MKKRKKTIKYALMSGFLGFLGLMAGLAGLREKTYLVTEITDGDTIKVQYSKSERMTVRLIGVDAPELGKGENPDKCYALEAKEMLKSLVLKKKVRLEFDENEMDRFGRYLGYVFADDIFVNQYLLENGAGIFFLDTVNLKYQTEFAEAGKKAHEEKLGLWQTCDIEKNGCGIKGNLDKNDKRWYHLPYFRHYDQVEVNLDHGDRWFCTEEEAIEAGFEKARE